MVKRDKRLEKAIESLEKQKRMHLEKIATEKGRKDTTRDYWLKEVEKFEKEIEKKKKQLGRQTIV